MASLRRGNFAGVFILFPGSHTELVTDVVAYSGLFLPYLFLIIC